MIQIATFVFNDFQENTHVLWDESKQCVIVDPGCFSKEEQQTLYTFITENNLTPVKLLNTHCHIDHVLGNNFVVNTFNLPLHLHEKELFTYNDVGRWAAMFGVNAGEIPKNLVYIDEGDTIDFGNTSLKIAFTPGHSIASLTFYHIEEKIAIAGDVLFYESIGRTDLPGGNFETLISSIRTKLFNWDDDMRIYSGHGPSTTVGHEKLYNPFLIA